jgi:hypothetical protein
MIMYQSPYKQCIQQLQADRTTTIPNNKPDIITRDSKNGTGRLIDAGISGDGIVVKK